MRPHDIRLSREPGRGRVPARVERVVRLGFEVRVELVTQDGAEPFAVQAHPRRQRRPGAQQRRRRARLGGGRRARRLTGHCGTARQPRGLPRRSARSVVTFCATTSG
ncbi:hypothetical protein GCM10025868_14980 [Angustibacter aerolatus]|uniref:Transport-associated OB type 2 domain-containing protein n=1 Tax=Angustibacter aerolatus TaxID=1162965 RepID=A0ABQ6JDM0_9ACTN|nr:TOBE domain-containing protein [Angustibacter aerolatus]GMA86248.1 hypothetical protein GCM10025868_14980 [Angustibacter aerolatus]